MSSVKARCVQLVGLGYFKLSRPLRRFCWRLALQLVEQLDTLVAQTYLTAQCLKSVT
jgi:hypothetical protein